MVREQELGKSSLARTHWALALARTLWPPGHDPVSYVLSHEPDEEAETQRWTHPPRVPQHVCEHLPM